MREGGRIPAVHWSMEAGGVIKCRSKHSRDAAFAGVRGAGRTGIGRAVDGVPVFGQKPRVFARSGVRAALALDWRYSLDPG